MIKMCRLFFHLKNNRRKHFKDFGLSTSLKSILSFYFFSLLLKELHNCETNELVDLREYY